MPIEIIEQSSKTGANAIANESDDGYNYENENELRNDPVVLESGGLDVEATLKNLSFHEVPNSVRRKNLLKNPSHRHTIDFTKQNLNNKTDAGSNQRLNCLEGPPMHSRNQLPDVHKTHSLASLDAKMAKNFDSENENKRRPLSATTNGSRGLWRGEFNNAFKKITSLSKIKKRYSSQIPTPIAPHGSIDLRDNSPVNEFTQDLASDLINSLLAGCPAALFPTTQFLRDEHGKKRVSMLLAMLNVTVESVNKNDYSEIFNMEEEDFLTSDDDNLNDLQRQMSLSSNSSVSTVFSDKDEQEYEYTFYKLNLEYGVGQNRLKWSVIRSYRELATLHKRLKIVAFQQNTINKLYIDNNRYHKLHIPSFPRHKDLKENDENAGENGNGNKEKDKKFDQRAQTFPDNMSIVSDRLTHNHGIADKLHLKHLENLVHEKFDINQPMHIRLQNYLRLTNVILTFRPQANRLFQFYEISPISNLLSYEEGYKGKEGYLVIRSTAKTQGWRVSHFRVNGLREMVKRHTIKWFLIRNSYFLYVSDMASTTPLDIFLVDSKFKVRIAGSGETATAREMDWNPHNIKKLFTKFFITIENSERKIQLITSSEYQLKQWMTSFIKMAKNTIWSKVNRFDSFAPVRRNAYCKFLVDGRDYFWALSDAFELAEDVIYIHDWWLSPELYMRRPVKGNQQYRLDRVLKRRAESGVKIFIVIYRNVGSTVGTDSSWTKHYMLNLHPNIHIIRSPNQWLQNTYFWAHHEKMVVIDNTVAFMGGIDLCYGRYDTPDHVLRDDSKVLKDQIFPGKDYSNARVCDFYELDKPFESMYDRNDLPRMPWHDVHTVIVGEPARDLARHFVQRWNYLLRQKRPSRPTPLLTPPSELANEDFKDSPIFKSLQPNSSCEVQILRSTGYWSMGLQETEKSIQNAYLKLIEKSEHYIYLENQFFITTSKWDGVIIENKIGDAIIDRIIRANSEGKKWKAIIVIPLMPGFDSPIDQPEASSLRLIMQCQYQCISRGESSIFARLRKLGIEPNHYIQFFSLRKWSTIGTNNKIVTEQLYVHAKLLIADDRSCIIGSANVNERSQAGNRDSEVAAVIRDTELISSTMDGKPYFAGKFAHELRQRLMREHLGCDVDLVELIERKFGRLKKVAESEFETLNTLGDKKNTKEKISSAMIELGYREVFDCDASKFWNEKYADRRFKNFGVYEDSDNSSGESLSSESMSDDHLQSSDNSTHELSNSTELPRKKNVTKPKANYHSFNNRAGEENIGIRDKKNISSDPRVKNDTSYQEEIEGRGPDGWKSTSSQFLQSVTEQLRKWAFEALSTRSIDGSQDAIKQQLPNKEDVESYLLSEDISSGDKWDMLKRVSYLQHLTTKTQERKKNYPACTLDDDSTKRSVENHKMHQDILKEQELDDKQIDDLLAQITPTFKQKKYSSEDIIKLSYVDPYSFEDPLEESFYEDIWFSIALRNTLLFRLVFHVQPDNSVQTWKDYKDYEMLNEGFMNHQESLIESELARMEALKNGDKESKKSGSNASGQQNASDIQTNSNEPTKPSQDFFSNDKVYGRKNIVGDLRMDLAASVLYGSSNRIFDRHTAKRILERVQGHLVIFPTEWLAKEIESRNWFYNSDRLPPIEIFD